MPRISMALAIALAAAPLIAQTGSAPAIPGTRDPSRVTAGTYRVDPAHTQIRWRLDHLGFSPFDGFFADPTGTLTIDPRRPNDARLSIVMPMARVVTTSGALDTHLKNADFFDVAKYPTATFVSTRVQATGQRARIAGNLTLHGVTRPVVLDARFVGAGNAPRGDKALNIGFEATTRIRRSEFGMGFGLPAIGDQVDIAINAAFVKQ